MAVRRFAEEASSWTCPSQIWLIERLWDESHWCIWMIFGWFRMILHLLRWFCQWLRFRTWRQILVPRTATWPQNLVVFWALKAAVRETLLKLKMRVSKRNLRISGVHFLRFHVNFQGCFVQYDPDGLHDEFAKYSVLKQDVWSGSHCNFGSCGSYHPQKCFGERESVVLTELNEVLRPSSIGASAKCWRQSCATASWIGLGESPSAVSINSKNDSGCILFQHCESAVSTGVWNFKGSSWKCLRGSIKSKSDGLWTACECTETSELIFLKIFFQLHETNWSWILQRGLVLHLWPWGVHFRSAESPRGTGDTSGGICVLFFAGEGDVEW